MKPNRDRGSRSKRHGPRFRSALSRRTRSDAAGSFRRRFSMEYLEDRAMLASCPVSGGDPFIVGGLQFCGQFSELSNGMLEADSQSSGVPTVVGLVTQEAEAFNPLLRIDGTTTIPAQGSSSTLFEVGQTVDHVETTMRLLHVMGSPTLWGITFDVQTFDATLLSGQTPGGLPLTGGTGKGITVAEVDSGFIAENLSFVNPDGGTTSTSDAQVWLQGTMNFKEYGFSQLNVGVEGANYVQVASDTNAVTLTGINATIDIPNFTLGGIKFEGALGASYTPAENEFGFVGDAKMEVEGLKSGTGDSMLDVEIGAPGSAGLVFKHGELTSFEVTISGQFKAWDLVIKPRTLTFEYATDDNAMFPDSFVMYGDIDVLIPNGAASTSNGFTEITASFGDVAQPGLAVDTQSGVVESVNIGLSGDINLLGFKLNIAPGNPARFSYDGSTQTYGLSGQLTAPQLWDATVIAGTSNTTGIQVQHGEWLVDNLSIEFSDVSLGAFKIKDFKVTFEQFEAMMVTGDVTSGSNQITNAMVAGSGALSNLQPGQPVSGTGIASDTKLGTVSDTTLNLSKNATQTVSDATFTFDAGLDLAFELFVVFPGGWEVDGEIDMLFNETTKQFELNEVFLKWQATNQASRIPIADTGLFLNEVDATLQNVNSPDIVVSGQITVEYGEEVKFFGKESTLFSAQGSFTVDKDHLEIDAAVYFGSFIDTGGKASGVLGSAHGQLLIDWNDRTYILDVQASFLRGTFTFEAEIEFSEVEGILFFAEADVNVPHGIPFIGGKKLGSLDFMMKFELPDDNDNGQAQGFVAAWTELNLIFKKVDVGIQYDFIDEKVKLIGKGTIQSDLNTQSQDPTKPYVYQQEFNVPAEGATQATLVADWSRAFPEGATLTKPTVTVVGEGWQTVHESAFAASNGISLLTQSAEDQVKHLGLVGSSSNELTPLPVGPNKSYTLQLNVTSDQPPRTDTAQVQKITSFENPDTTKSVLITLAKVPDDIQTGDVLTLSGSSVSAYNTNHTIVQITDSGQLITDQTWTANDQTGAASIKNWYVPQFHSTFHIPQTVFAENNPIAIDATGNIDMQVAIAGLASLQQNAVVDVYVDQYDAASPQQDFSGSLISKGIALNGTGGSSLDPVTLGASTTIDLTQLDPALTYYVYAIVNDGTNPTATSPASAPFQVLAAVEGQVLNVEPGQTSGEGLAGWTVFADENANGELDAGEIHTTTISNGDFSFLPSQTESMQIGSITEDSGSGKALVSFSRAPVHGIRVGSSVTLTGTTGYDGTFTVESVASEKQVVINRTYGSTSVGGTATSQTAFPTDPISLVVEQLNNYYTFESPASGSTPFTYNNSNNQQVDFLLNEKSTIKGVLHDTEGNPLAGWVVYQDANANGSWDPGETSVTTDTFGNYRFPNPQPGTYTVAMAIDSGATASYAFNDISGSLVVDTSGSKKMHSGTLTNGASVGTADSFGIEQRPHSQTDNQVVRLGGALQFVDVPYSPDLEPGTTAFSTAGWVRADDFSAVQTIAASFDASQTNKPGWRFGMNASGQLFVILHDQNGKALHVVSQKALDSNTWAHVAFTYDGTNQNSAVKLFVNGVAQKKTVNNNTLPAAVDITSGGASFKLGAAGDVEPVDVLTGYLDDVSVWKDQLSQQQVQAHLLGTTLPGYLQESPAGPGTYSVTIDSTGTDVEAGNDFQVQQLAAVSGAAQLSSATVVPINDTVSIGGATGSITNSNDGYNWKITSNGRLGPRADALSFAYSPISGDGTFSTFVLNVRDSLGNTPDAQGGIMYRASLDVDAPFVAVWVQANNQVAFQYRAKAGEPASTPVLMGDTADSKFIQLEREGNLFTASFSIEDQPLKVVGSQTVDLPDSAFAGLYAASGIEAIGTVASFWDVAYTTKTPGSGGSVNLLQDGAVIATSTLFDDGSYLVPGLPPGNYDIQQFAPDGYVQSGPFYNAITYSNQNYAGLNADPYNSLTVGDFDRDGINDMAFTSPGSSIVAVAYGNGDGTFTDPQAYSAGTSVTDPIKITSEGGKGANLWVLDGTSGEVVRLVNVNGGRTAQFAPVSATGLLPTGVTPVDITAGPAVRGQQFPNGQDVGNPPIAGSSTYNSSNGQYTLKGSGNNNTRGGADFGSDFYFQSVPSTGDGVFIVNVPGYKFSTGINGDAIAGIMIRNGTAADDNFVSASIQHSPGSGDSLGTVFNWRSSGQNGRANLTTPEIDSEGAWLRMIKTGNLIEVFTKFAGPVNGWQKIGEQTVDLNANFEIGLFVSSASSGNATTQGPGPLASAVFASISSTFATPAQAVVSYQGANGGTNTGFSVLQLPPSGTPQVLYASDPLLYSGDVAVTDINSDGHPDVLLNGGNNANEVTLALSDGSGSFRLFAVPMPAAFSNGGAISAADVDGDQRLDLLVADRLTGDLYVALQDAGGGFPLSQMVTRTTAGNVVAKRVAAVDLNGDALPELVALPVDGTDDRVNVFVNGLGSEPPYPVTPLTFTAFDNQASTLDLALADFNKDKVADFFVLAKEQADATVMLTDPTHPKTETIPVVLTAGQLLTGNDFTDSLIGNLSGTVYQDTNPNLAIDGADTGHGGAIVYLDLDQDGRLSHDDLRTVTDQDGAYHFGNLAPGAYDVRLHPVAGRLSSIGDGSFANALHSVTVGATLPSTANDFLVISNESPSYESLGLLKENGSERRVQEDEVFTLWLRFTDTDHLTYHRISVDWGDGSTLPSTSPLTSREAIFAIVDEGLGSFELTHAYADAGTYEVRLTITDARDEAVLSTARFVVIVDEFSTTANTFGTDGQPNPLVAPLQVDRQVREGDSSPQKSRRLGAR